MNFEFGSSVYVCLSKFDHPLFLNFTIICRIIMFCKNAGYSVMNFLPCIIEKKNKLKYNFDNPYFQLLL